MTKPPNARPHGQLRQSQVVTTFGPGAMLDLPDHSVLVSGLDHWMGVERQVFEERLAAKVDALLETAGVKLFTPPVDPPEPGAASTGIPAWQFPEWFGAQYEEPAGGAEKGDQVQVRRRPLVHRRQLVGGKFQAPDRKRYPVVPIRFVAACVNGHLSDIDWYGFVHDDFATKCRRPLWLAERGTSGDLADVFVECECGRSRSLARATRLDDNPLGNCGGARPWLGPAAGEKCGGAEGGPQRTRLLIRSASNAYFPLILRVISIPDRDAVLRKAVDGVWEDFLQYVETREDLVRERRKQKVRVALEGLDDDLAFAEVRRRKSGAPGDKKSIKQAELETLVASEEEMGEDAPDGDFYAKAVRLESASAGPLAIVERVVLVHRLREVMAQVGFTRFEADAPDVNGELGLGVRRAALAREVSWVPAVENRGEGVFVAFRGDAIDAWLSRPEVKTRGVQLLAGFAAWQKAHPGSPMVFPGTPYIMLHSLAHLLITAISLECGYSASSIRERVYAGETGYGILLYTGTPDAEGTLGGLVQVGRHIGRHLRNALELGRLCANDPVCAQHAPESREEDRFLSGAACHGCLLIAETSCERRNEFLDRALVVPTVEGLGAELFADPSS